MALLVKRQDELLAELKEAADEGFPHAKEEWERGVAAWGNAHLMLRELNVTDFFFHQRRNRRRAKWRVHQLKTHLLLGPHRYPRGMIAWGWTLTGARMGRVRRPRKPRIRTRQ